MSSVTPQLRLYNTLTRSKEVFTPIDPANVRMYVCGPTVYDFAHIGNARPVIVFDVLFRLLRHLYGEKHVTYVRNITDVDDKINDRAARDFPGLPLNDAIRRVTESTANQYMADVKALGCLEPTQQPRATENIAEMIEIIKTLIAKGHAYVAAGEVLFSVTSMPDYGQLSNRKLDDQQAGARVAVEAHKRNPGDFVLWKLSSENEPGWGSPWGRGRPGWHIECSAMSKRYLGEVFDIHGGGLDLIFPHHENEIAQTRCAFGHDVMANVWMHNGFLQVEGEKMSKSVGNFVTINELLTTEKFGGRKWPGNVIRLAMLKTHYRQPIDWTVKDLLDAEIRIEKWRDFAADRTIAQINHDMWQRFLEVLADDLNTPGACNFVDEVVSSKTAGDRERYFVYKALKLLGLKNKRSIPSQGLLACKKLMDALSKMGERDWDYVFDMTANNPQLRNGELRLSVKLYASMCVLNEYFDRFVRRPHFVPHYPSYLQFQNGLRDHITPTISNQDDKIAALVSARTAARAAKNWAESDRIRDQLASMGVQLKDAKDPVTGEMKTTWEVKR